MNRENALSSEKPLLSVVVAIVSDTVDRHYDLSHLDGCLKAFAEQEDPPPLEVIVPYPTVLEEQIAEIKSRFPWAKFLSVSDLKTFDFAGGSREHHDELRARGLAVAQGQIVGLVEDHARPDPLWSMKLAEAHEQNHAAVGGAIENGIDRALNWAVYFCDFGKYQNPLDAGETSYISDANVSYKRSVLESVESIWQSSFHEPEVNWAITSRGGKLALAPKMIVYQYRKDLKFGEALEERFVWGRSYAATRSSSFGLARRGAYTILSLLLPVVLLIRMALNVFRKGRNRGAFIRALPLTALLTVMWSLGEMVGYMTARSHGGSEHMREQMSQAPVK